VWRNDSDGPVFVFVNIRTKISSASSYWLTSTAAADVRGLSTRFRPKVFARDVATEFLAFFGWSASSVTLCVTFGAGPVIRTPIA